MKAELGLRLPSGREAEGAGEVIARLMGEGQFEIYDELARRLTSWTTRRRPALERSDEARLRDLLGGWRSCAAEGSRLPDDYLGASDLIIPPTDLTLDEARELFEARASSRTCPPRLRTAAFAGTAA